LTIVSTSLWDAAKISVISTAESAPPAKSSSSIGFSSRIPKAAKERCELAFCPRPFHLTASFAAFTPRDAPGQALHRAAMLDILRTKGKPSDLQKTAGYHARWLAAQPDEARHRTLLARYPS